MHVGLARQAAPTSTGTLDFTVSGAGTCGAAIFYLTRATADDTASNIAAFGYGATDGTNQWAVAGVSHNAQLSTNTRRRGMTDECVALLLTAGTVDGEAAFDSFITDGVRINCGDAFASGWLITAVLFFEDSGDLSAHAGTFDTGSGNVDVTAPGFRPKCVNVATMFEAINDTTQNRCQLGMGWAVDGVVTPPAQVGFNFFEGNVQPNGRPAAFVPSESSKEIVHQANYTTDLGTVRITTFDASGFTAEQLDGAGFECGYLALDFPEDVSVDVYTTPTSTGNQAFTAPGFEPQAVLGFLSAVSTADSVRDSDEGGSWGFFAFTADAAYCATQQHESGSANTDTQSLVDSKPINLPADDGASTLLEATFVSMDASGFTLNFSTADATGRFFGGIAIETGAQPVEVTPDPAVIQLGATAPTLDVPVDVAPDPAEVTLGATAPTLDVPVDVAPTPPRLQVVATTPTLDVPVEVTPSAAVIQLGATAPALEVPVDVAPGSAQIQLGATTPTVDAPVEITPTAPRMQLVGTAPALEVPVDVAPDPAVLEVGAPIPLIGSDVNVTPDPAVIALGVPAPTLDVPVELRPGEAVVELGAPAPQLESAVNVTPSAAVIQLGATAPTLDVPVDLAPGTALIEARAPIAVVNIPTGTVAALTAKNTRIGDTLLRGTIPVPDDWTPTDLLVRDDQLQAWPAQWRTVVKGPTGNPRVIKLESWLTSPGGPQSYTVEEGTLAPTGSFPLNIDMTLACEDHNGVTYSAPMLVAGPADGGAGKVTHQERRFGELLSTGGARFLGYDAYVTTIRGEPDIFLVDMEIQNGTVGVPILHDLFFNELRLELPAGWEITHLVAGPRTAPERLITSQGGTAQHVLCMGDMTEFRFAVHTSAAAGRASVLLGRSGFFTCDFSKSLWSWSNPATAWWGPQAALVPERDLTGYEPYGASWAEIKAALEGGFAEPGAEIAAALGPFQPRGPTDGGVTGGQGITGFTGYELLNRGDVDDLLTLMAVQKTDKDRQRGICLVGTDQLPIDCADWDLSDIQFLDVGVFNVNHDGPFPRPFADTTRLDEVTAAGDLPWYYGTLKGYAPYKFSHLIRGMGSSLALVWADDDPLARKHIGNLAPWCRMRMLEYGHGDLFQSWNGPEGALTYPGKGGVGGRFAGWPMVCISADFQINESETKRTNYLPWLSMMKSHHGVAQLPSGNWHASTGKPSQELFDLFGVSVAASQSIEIGINAQGLRCVWVCDGDDAYFGGLFRTASAGTWGYHWKPSTGGAHRIAPVRELDKSLPAWATQAEAPAAFTTDTDNFQLAPIPLFALVFNPAFPAPWSIIFAMTGTSTPEAARDALDAQMPTKMAEGWGALLAWLQDYTFEPTVMPSPAVIELGAPTGSVDAPVNVSPSPAVIELGATAPVLTDPVEVTPSAAQLQLAGTAPTLEVPVEVTPSAAQIVLGAPAPVADSPVDVAPGSAQVVVGAVTPDPRGGTVIANLTTSIEVRAIAPTLDVPVEVTPSAAVLELAGVGPAVDVPIEVTPSAAQIVLGAPTAAPDAPVEVLPDPAELQLGGVAPALEVPVEVTPSPAVVELGAVPPTAPGVVMPSPAVIILGAVEAWNLEAPGLDGTLVARLEFTASLTARQAIDAELALVDD